MITFQGTEQVTYFEKNISILTCKFDKACYLSVISGWCPISRRQNDIILAVVSWAEKTNEA